MACNTILTREFLKDKLGLKWLTKELYVTQKANLLATEKARFNQDVDEALRVKAAKERFAEVMKLRHVWNKLQKRQAELIKPHIASKISKSELINELLTIKQQQKEITNEIEKIEQDSETQILLSNYSDKKFEYTIRCPKQDCVGFANDLGRCSHCQIFICQTCHEEASEGHICDQDTIKNVLLLQQDTKGCPKCNTPIHKIEGCDQMWCTQCKTAFSWNTGKIEKGIIHNPHYYQWQQGQNEGVRNVGDQACGGIPTRQTINRLVQAFGILLNGKPKIGKETKSKILFLRNITLGHFVLLNTIQDDLDEQRHEIQQREETLRSLRIRVLTGEIKDENEYINKHLNNFLHKQAYAVEAIPIYKMATACVIERINETIDMFSYGEIRSLVTELAVVNAAELIAIVFERLEKIHSELISIYKYVAHELIKLTSYYPKILKNRGQDIADLFEEIPRISKECEKIVMDGYSNMDNAWTNPITERFGQV